MNKEAEHYLALSRKYFRDAHDMLGKDDYVQASEKLWGAAADMVKAVAMSKENVDLKTHGDLWKYVTKLHLELKDPEISRMFGLANTLHQNFYEAMMTPEAVQVHAEAVRHFIEKLEKLTET